MINTNITKSLLAVFVALFFVSCDKDFNSIGSDIVGNENFDFNDGEPFEVKAYNQKTGVIQTNNLLVNQLGVINSPVFGRTTAHFVTQLEMNTPKPTFGTNVVIDSVVVTVPYFNTKKATDANGRSEYELDSIHGNGTLDMHVYENGYYLKQYDPNTNFTTAQRYYSDEKGTFDSNKIGLPVSNPELGTRLNDWIDPKTSLSFEEKRRQNTHFYPDKREYVKFKVDDDLVPTTTVESRNAPRLRMRLNNDYFKDRIINAPASKLIDNNVFKDYFRGLYFQVNSTNETLMSLDFSKGDVTIYYKQDNSLSGRVLKEFRLNFAGTTVNLFENDFNPTYSGAIDPAVVVGPMGAPSLYLKGGDGSAAFIEILQDPAEKAQLKGKLINHAYLSFTIDQTAMQGIAEPNRIYIYNADKNRPLYDYFFDNSDDDFDFKKNKYLHGGIIEKETVGAEKRGVRYKINITEHVNNIVNKDSTNVRLGIVVTENINLSGSAFMKTPILSPKKVDRFPVSSVMNPLGTVLFGTDSSVPADKRVQFKVYYTKPN